jgi:D-alanine-D-alanine ligase
MNKKTRITVLMGGQSSEHDVSIASGKEIIKNLDKNKYLISPIVISKNGKGIEEIIKNKPDIAFIALHGKYGEDGKIQGMLETLGIAYTGSGVFASAIGMDKIVFRKLMQIESIAVPEYVVLEKGMLKVPKGFNPPYFVKPFDGGSSVGVSFVDSFSKLDKAVELAFKYSDKVIVEKYIKGLEVNCGVLGNEKPIALPVIEIHPLKAKFFDYKSKYSKGGSDEIVPAKISEELTKKVQDMAVKVYKSIGCLGYARVDFILENGVNPIVLEINTLPGMTSASLLPKEAKVMGITYSTLLDKIIKYAKEKN